MSDIYVSSSGNDSTGTGAIGSPYLTPGKAGLEHVGGDTIYIKAGTYTLANTTVNTIGGPLVPKVGTSAAPTRVIGYNAAVGDLNDVNDFANFPVLAASAGGGVPPLQLNNAHGHAFNLDCNGASQSSRSIWVQGGNARLVNCRGRASTAYGIAIDATTVAVRCVASGNPTRGIYCAGPATLVACVATGNSGPGVYVDAVRVSLLRCLVYGNTGASTDGLIVAGSFGPWVWYCSVHGNGRDGIRLVDATSGDAASIRNNAFWGNTGQAVNSATTTYTFMDLDYNAYASGKLTGVPAGAHDVILTGDPFTASGSGDFSSNATSGPGAALRAAGSPAAWPLGLTTGSSPDIGAYQHAGGGGGGGGGLIGGGNLSGGLQ